MIKTVYIIRHGNFQVPHPRPEAYMTKKFSLSVTGIEDVVCLGHEIKKREKIISKIYTSPYLRCIESAEILSKMFNGCPVELNDGISEDSLTLANTHHLKECYNNFRSCVDLAIDNDGIPLIISHEFPISVFVSKSSGISFEEMLKNRRHLEIVKMGECVVAKFNEHKLVSYEKI